MNLRSAKDTRNRVDEERTICRFCFISSYTYAEDEFSDFGETNDIGEILGIKLQEEDGIPTNICSNCEDQIETTRLLRQRARFSEAVWAKYLHRRSPNQLHEEVDDKSMIPCSDLLLNCHLCGCGFNYENLVSHIKSAHENHIPECQLCLVILNRKEEQTVTTTDPITADDEVLKEENPEEPMNIDNNDTQDEDPDEEAKSESESEADNSSDENFSPKKDSSSSSSEEEETEEPEDRSRPTVTESKGNEPLKPFGNGKHACDLCEKRYVKKDTLRNHKRKIHNIDPLACLTCYKQYKSRSELNSHIQSVHRFRSIGKGQFKCKYCPMSYEYENKYLAHLQLHPDAPEIVLDRKKAKPMYPCKFCDKFYTRIVHLDQHMMTHSSTPFQCEMCDTPPFASRNEMLDHVKEVHIFKCPQCTKSFDSKEKLNEHVLWHKNCIRQCQYCDHKASIKELKAHCKNVHQKTFRCSVCHEMFATRQEMDEHIKTHDTISCPDCKSEFPTIFSLRLHENVHKPTTSAAPRDDESVNEAEQEQSNPLLPCPKCDQTFSKRDRLKLHLQNKHHVDGFWCRPCKTQFDRKADLTNHTCKARSRLCTICGIRMKSSLIAHMRRHLGINPFKCKFEGCTKEFPRNGDLKVHKLTHTGEKPFACEVCGMRFPIKSKIKPHMRTHTGEKPYKCTFPDCNEAFAQSFDRTLHLRRHIGDKPFECEQCGERFYVTTLLKTHKKSCKGKTT